MINETFDLNLNMNTTLNYIKQDMNDSFSNHRDVEELLAPNMNIIKFEENHDDDHLNYVQNSKINANTTFDKELINSLKYKQPLENYIKKTDDVVVQNESTLQANSHKEKEKEEPIISTFKKNIRNLKAYTENYLEVFKKNFTVYIENQKNYLTNYLTTIEDLLDIEAKNSLGEETKINTIERKMNEFTREFNIIVGDLSKLKS